MSLLDSLVLLHCALSPDFSCFPLPPITRCKYAEKKKNQKKRENMASLSTVDCTAVKTSMRTICTGKLLGKGRVATACVQKGNGHTAECVASTHVSLCQKRAEDTVPCANQVITSGPFLFDTSILSSCNFPTHPHVNDTNVF